MKKFLDYEVPFDDSDEDSVTPISPLDRTAMPSNIKLATVCDVSHGRRIDSALPYFDQLRLGANWKTDISDAADLGYICVADDYQKLRFCTAAELKVLLKQFGQKVGGNKSELIDRIKETISIDNIKASIPFDFWMRTEMGDELLDDLAVHVINYYRRFRFNSADVEKYSQEVKQAFGKVEVDRVLYMLCKDELDKDEENLKNSWPCGEWGTIQWLYSEVCGLAKNLGNYDEAIRCLAYERTIFLSGLVNGGYIKDFKWVHTPTFQSFADLMIKSGWPVEYFCRHFMDVVKHVYAMLPFHYFKFDALQQMFETVISGHDINLMDYSPATEFSSTNYEQYFKVDLVDGEVFIRHIVS